MASVGAATSPRATSRTSPPRRAASRSTASSSRCSSPRRWTTRFRLRRPPHLRRPRGAQEQTRGAPPAPPPPRPTTSATSSSRTPPSSTACTTPSPCSTRTRPPPTRCAPRWRLKAQNAKLAAGVAGGDGGSRRRRHRLRGTQNHRRGEHQTPRGERRAQDAGAAAAARVAARAPRARRAPGRRVSEARRSLFRGSEREENLRAELKAVTTELRLMRRERDDANRTAQAAQTDAANAESSKRRMLAKTKGTRRRRADASRRRETERELRVKVKDLSTQCDGLERRLRASGVNVLTIPSVVRAPSPGRVGYGASPRRRRPAAAREPRGVTRRHALARARRSNPDPRGSTGFRTPTHARSPSPARGTVADAASGGVVPGAKIRSHRYVRENNATREGSETARGVSPAARARRAPRHRPRGNDRGTAREVRAARGDRVAGGRERRTARADIGDRRGGESPGRVLRDVKNKLEDLASKGGADAGAEGRNARRGRGSRRRAGRTRAPRSRTSTPGSPRCRTS